MRRLMRVRLHVIAALAGNFEARPPSMMRCSGNSFKSTFIPSTQVNPHPPQYASKARNWRRRPPSPTQLCSLHDQRHHRPREQERCYLHLHVRRTFISLRRKHQRTNNMDRLALHSSTAAGANSSFPRKPIRDGKPNFPGAY